MHEPREDDGKSGALLASAAKLAQRMSVLYEEDRGRCICTYRYRGETLTRAMAEINMMSRVEQLTMIEEWREQVDSRLGEERSEPVGDEFSRGCSAIRAKLDMAYEEHAAGRLMDALTLLGQISTHLVRAHGALLDEALARRRGAS